LLSVRTMKRMTKLLAVGSLLALGWRWLTRRSAFPSFGASKLGSDRIDQGMSPLTEAPDLDGTGIAEVDPVPLSHVAGEGIDLDRDVEAHSEIRELRERLPQPGKNLP
jgi:hypothetical protein